MRFAVITLGCKVNFYESESYIESLQAEGFTLVDQKEHADIYIVNSCAVTNAAAQKSRQQINRAHRLNPDALMVVVGCYVQVESDTLMESDHIDLLVGSNKKSELVDLIKLALEGKKIIAVDKQKRDFTYEDLAVTSFNSHQRAFLKVQDGCDQFCSFCIIPFARGKERSLALDSVLKHANFFVNRGHKEIVLSGIHTGRYGHDLETNLYTLLDTLLKKEQKLARLRVSSIEILEIEDDIIDLAKNNHRLANHWHIPLQSGSDKTLKAMNRRYLTKEYKQRITEIREKLDNVSISADVIVGFPGESERDFEETYQFIKGLGLSFLHVFPYSPKSKTRAAHMSDQVPNEIKKSRVRRLLELSESLKANFMEKFIGQSVSVLVESYTDKQAKGYSSEYFEVVFDSETNVINEMVDVKIVAVKEGFAYGKRV